MVFCADRPFQRGSGPAECKYKGKHYKIKREPTRQEYDDLLFGWLVESGITSNSVIYVKNQVTVGIGTGEQDRVGVAEIARDKAHRKLADRYCFEDHGLSYNDLQDVDLKKEIIEKLKNKIEGSEVALSIASGTGKEHMALISALLALPVGIKFVVLTREGIKELC